MIFLFVHLTFGVFIFFLIIAFITGAPFVPSSNATANAMIAQAKIQNDSIIYDLGSGDGKLLFLAKKMGGKKIIGIEINPFLVLFTKLKIFFSRQKAIQVRLENFWSANISDADIVFVYLLPWKMEKLAEKLKNELKPGSIIVTNSFIFPRWKILREDAKHHVYVFKV